MNTNAWNLRGSKERLDIMNRTQAQKRHMIGVLSAKSKIDTHGNLSFRQPSSPIGILRRKMILSDNLNLTRKLVNISKSPSRHTDSLNTSMSLSRNLNTYSSVNRNIKQRAIDQENSKLLSRLITTSATLQRQKWAQSNEKITRYKENLHRGKCKDFKYVDRQPDYSKEACKLICREPKFKMLHIGASESIHVT